MPKMPKIIQGKYKILFNKKVGPGHYTMRIYAPEIVQNARPGQFVHLLCSDNTEPLLRRPFSFHRIDRNSFDVLYRVMGIGTNLLAKRPKGDTIDLIGPLGNGFDLPKLKDKKQARALLIGAGMGIAPLLALAQKIKPGKNIAVLIGAKNKNQISCADEFCKLGAKVHFSTDDGSLGHKGLITDLLKKILLSTVNCQLSTIYACGPKPMLQKLTQLSRNFNVRAFGSLEENMACGVGACLGCAVGTKFGYQRVCKEGPVFDLGDILW